MDIRKGVMAERELEPPPAVRRCLPELLPKHTIFLSHSGDDKPFVERLYEELKRVNHSPFFDQDSNSLPKGERFTSLIFQAAEQCLLAVVVLSKSFLTSKWPMLELAAFVKAKETNNPNLKLFPLFYKLLPSDLVATNWAVSWTKMVEEGKIQGKEIEVWSKAVEVLMKAKNVEIERTEALTEQVVEGEIEAEKYSKLLSEAVRGLRPFNGMEFGKSGTSEGKYIKEVVDEICKTVPPRLKYNVDRIRGYQRMCEMTSAMFEEGMSMGGICKEGCSYLGLFGMGGVGKSTLCEAMCGYYQAEFGGKVCHVELQGEASKEERIERLKYVIQKLAGLENRIVDTITSESQGLEVLQGGLRDQPRVFLVVDNVGDSQSSREEAQAYISARLARGSKVMVTSRSRLILECVLDESKCCKPIPRLEEREAEELFLSIAAPRRLLSSLQPAEAKIVQACIGECLFADDGYVTQQYHPLVLRALGSYFQDVDKDKIMNWEEALMVEKKVQGCRESKHVNDILGLKYRTLSTEQKLFFLDLVFLFGERSRRYTLLIRACEKFWETGYGVLAAVHGVSPFDVKIKVKELQRKSLIYESGPVFTMHDLYIEFAHSLIKEEGSKEWEWWVGLEDLNGNYPMLKRLFLFQDKSWIGRAPEQLWECRSLVFLHLYLCDASVGQSLDLRNLKNLCVLIMVSCKIVEEIVCSCNDSRSDLCCYERKNRNGGCLPKLQKVVVYLCGVKRIPFLRHCWNLKSLYIDEAELERSDFTNSEISLFENLEELEALSLFYSYSPFPLSVFDEILEGRMKLKRIKYLEIMGTRRGWAVPSTGGSGVLDVSILGLLTSLSVVSLPYLPKCIWELKGLDQLLRLNELNLECGRGLREVPDLDLMPSLRRICVSGCNDMKDPRGLLIRFQGIHSAEHRHNHECLIAWR